MITKSNYLQVKRQLSSLIGPVVHQESYNVYDLYNDGKLIAKVPYNGDLTLSVEPSGVAMVRVVPATTF